MKVSFLIPKMVGESVSWVGKNVQNEAGTKIGEVVSEEAKNEDFTILTAELDEMLDVDSKLLELYRIKKVEPGAVMLEAVPARPMLDSRRKNEGL